VNLTGSGDFGARIRVSGDPGAGCSSNQFAQFQRFCVSGAVGGSVGLESSNKLSERVLYERDRPVAGAQHQAGRQSDDPAARRPCFNAPNAAGITGRSSSMTMTSPSDPVTIVNNQYKRRRHVNPTRVKTAERWLRCGERPGRIHAPCRRTSGFGF